MYPIEQLMQAAYAIREGLDEAIYATSLIKKPPGGYSARFAFSREVLSWFHGGFCLDGQRSLPRKKSYRNVAVIGGTGSGKTSTTVIPSLFKMKGSFVINDVSTEIYFKSAGQLKRRGYIIKVINLADATKGDGFNPLKRIRSASQANQVAHLLIRSTLVDSKDSFWNLQAQTLLTVLFKALKKKPVQFQNLANARHLARVIAARGKDLKDFFSDSEYETFLSYDPKVRGSILATVLASLQLLADPQVELATSYDTIDFQALRYQKTALFIHTPPTQVNYFRSLNSIFFEQLFQSLLATLPLRKELDLWFLLDEAGSSLLLPNLASYIAQVRKYRIGLMLLLQDRSNQLIANYGIHQTETILANCYSQLYLSGQSFQQAKTLEVGLGMTEVNGLRRPLISVDEVRTLPKNTGLLICGNYQPMKVRLTPYYQHLLYQYQARWKPQPLKRELPFTKVPKLKLFHEEPPRLSPSLRRAQVRRRRQNR